MHQNPAPIRLTLICPHCAMPIISHTPIEAACAVYCPQCKRDVAFYDPTPPTVGPPA